MEKFKVDDDYLWRIFDIATRQTVEKQGYKYGKVTTTFHYHHSTDEVKYKSDSSKAARKLIFQEPKEIVINLDSWRNILTSTAKAYVKYIDPTLPYVKNDLEIERCLLPLLDREWVDKELAPHGSQDTNELSGRNDR